METVKVMLYVLVFPGFLFQSIFSTYLEWVDRKLYARMQNRRGPLYTGWSGILQPVADIVKLFAKEDVTPAASDKFMFNILPLVALASACTAGLYLPVWHLTGYNSFQGDLIVMVYLLAMPSFVLFLAGWFSVSPFSLIGATRVLTQLFAYEVPFFLALLTPAVVAGSWKIADIAKYPWVSGNWWVIPLQVLAFIVAVLALQAKLERVPFDIPEAETEVVAGPLTEYSGKKLAVFRLQKDISMYAGSALIAALFLGGFGGGLYLGALQLVLKTLLVVALLSVIRGACARIRLDQIVSFSWRYLAPMSIVQFLIVLLLKGGGVI
ncbi:MAG TPA: NADH-quinone oxidoreductase subunit H [Acidobacteriota bacterium]|jgi:NADH-quinone oxidoreductase subunit H|nr:NADH-quinone oxidoreductase subunit H [Acidobacteriota bacterium]HNU02293.1 NADH-quinone oxidoreductase subunit H [Acidobacteriota bacterium]HPB27531.1 NADH-quinone oxidoreductase subunit H [Acidobacteriota bacterium]HQO27353.1 NADH-quinone oxidoreductase subunit H [Acidobacteriota bacterium]HQP72655.1 NADH-quinone oxidoreductase subunit H [Acidobacteriota bacterium]